MGETTFHLFPLFPPELRDTIWELCLPHRILELDLPSPDYIFNTRYLYSVAPPMSYDDGDSNDNDDEEEEQPSLDYTHSCILKHTTYANSAAPLIASVCRESRAVAFRCGGFLHGDVLNKDVPPNHLLNNTRYDPVPKFWFDRTRDRLHLHWQPYGYMAQDTQFHISPDTAPFGNYVSLLRQLYDDDGDNSTIASTNKNQNPSGRRRRRPATIASITDDLLDVHGSFGEKRIIRHIASRKEWLVCSALIVIHVHPSRLQIALKQSPLGLWGLLGDERIVCVDAFDTVTLGRYREFWRTYGSRPEAAVGNSDKKEEEHLAAAFFHLCDVLGGEEKEAIVHCNELPRNFVEDLTVRWLLNALLWAPEQNGVIDGGDNSSNDHSQLDPLERKDIWLHTPADGFAEPLRQSQYEVAEPFARQMWKPDTSHPWVKDRLNRMPVFRPTVMFRLCTNDCMDEG